MATRHRKKKPSSLFNSTCAYVGYVSLSETSALLQSDGSLAALFKIKEAEKKKKKKKQKKLSIILQSDGFRAVIFRRPNEMQDCVVTCVRCNQSAWIERHTAPTLRLNGWI